jgi:HK97 family phage prohead protease
MKVEIRNDSVSISGYVNAVERESKTLRDKSGQPFVEKIAAGAFKRSLSRRNNVQMLLNHDEKRVLGDTKTNVSLTEDSIGLKIEATVTDPDVITAARENRLAGFSFGFIPLRDAKTPDTERNLSVRTVTELDLLEVSLLSGKNPAYNGTLVEAREIDDELYEYRFIEDECEIVDSSESKEDREEETQPSYSNYSFKNRLQATYIGPKGSFFNANN